MEATASAPSLHFVTYANESGAYQHGCDTIDSCPSHDGHTTSIHHCSALCYFWEQSLAESISSAETSEMVTSYMTTLTNHQKSIHHLVKYLCCITSLHLHS